MAEGQLAQHVGVGGVAGLRPTHRRQLQLLEEDLGELLGRGDGELLAGQQIDLAGEVVEVSLELLRERLEASGIDADAMTLHEGQDRDERTLHLLVDRPELARLELGGGVLPVAPDERRPSAEGVRRIGIRRALAERLHANLLELVRRTRRVQEIGGDRRVVRGRRGDRAREPGFE
jgi:hypothetical protein